MPYLDTRHKKKSFTLTTFLLSVLLLILFYIGMTYMDPPIENGISVNFGTTDFGSGNVQPKEKIRSEPMETPPVEPVEQEEEVVEEIVEEEVEEEAVEEEVVEEEVVEEEVPEKVSAEAAAAEKLLTQEKEEAIKMKKAEETKKKVEDAKKDAQKKAEEAKKAAEKKVEDAKKAAKKKAEEAEHKKKAVAARVAQQKKDAEEKARQEQEAKKKELDALMGGLNKSEGTASGSEGDDNRAGDKGSPDGDPYATSYYGSPGSGSGTGGFGLNGRSLSSKGAVKQDCNEEGRVVVKIVVDRNGNVVSAQPGVKGTTNNSPCLLKPAKETAFKHRWNQDSNAPSSQVGFVVVNFKLGE